METNIHDLAKQVKYEYLDDVDEKSIKNALNALSSKNGIHRIEVERQRYIDEESLFCDINSVIEYLDNLKDEGYTSIKQGWSGYEDNYFVAVKMTEETDEEYLRRLAEIVSSYLKYLKEENLSKERAKKEKRIKQLEKELNQLKSEI